MIRLIQLCERLGPSLRKVGPHSGPPVDLTGVHISELLDPTPYLEGGELLLTTGIPFRSGTDVPAYVDRLVTRGVVALGLGLGAGTDTLPAALVEACAAQGLPLFVVPEGTPFLHISRAYWDLVGTTARADLAASLSLQTSLARAATQPEAVSSVVTVLANALDGWAVYLPADGAAETCWPPARIDVLPALREETKRLDLAGTRTGASFEMSGADVLEYSIVDGPRTAGFLALCAGRPLRPADRQLVATGCMLLAVTAQREWQLARAASLMSSIVATLVINGFADAARLVAAGMTGAPLSERVRLLAIRGDGVEGLSLAELADQVGRMVAPPNAEHVAASIRKSRLRCTSDGLSYVILESPIDLGTSTTVGHNSVQITAALGEPVMLGALHSGVAEVKRACLNAARGQLAAGRPAGALDSRVAGWVLALTEHTRADLVSTVRSYLRHHGQWEAAARELGVHRNSVRHRIGIARTLIGVDLDDPDVSATLWLALRGA